MEDTTPKQLAEALAVYRGMYGKGEIDMFKLDELIKELKDASKTTTRKSTNSNR